MPSCCLVGHSPPPPPPPSPRPTGPICTYAKDGYCLVADVDAHHVAMGPCSGLAAQWQTGWVRGHPSLESAFLRKAHSNISSAWCLQTGQVIANNTCHATPGIRSCEDGIPGSSKGGNPLGCGFSYEKVDNSGMIRALTCKDGRTTCLGADSKGMVLLVPCNDASAKGWTQHPAPDLALI